VIENDLLALLVAASVGVANTTIFIGAKAALPPQTAPAPFMSLKMTGGMTPERTQNTTQPAAFQQPGAQIVARAPSYAAAKAMAYAAYAALNVRNTIVNSRWYREISPRQEPADTGQDEFGRQMFTFNIRIITQGQ
jgi:hypothetical protein